MGSGQTGAGDNFTLTEDNMDKLKDALEKSVREMTQFEALKDQIEMTVTAEGLRVELMESSAGTFFPVGTSDPNDSGKEILVRLAQELAKLPNQISIEGHTDAKPYAGSGTYSNWELSADRANAARRLMQQSGLHPHQVSQIRGYADERLRKAKEPEDPSNRRITVIVQHIVKPPEAGGAAPEPAKKTENPRSPPLRRTIDL